MDDRLKDLYAFARVDAFAQIHLQDLRQQCCQMEDRVYGMMEKLSEDNRQILRSYIAFRDKLEFYGVKAALRFEKSIGRK